MAKKNRGLVGLVLDEDVSKVVQRAAENAVRQGQGTSLLPKREQPRDMMEQLSIGGKVKRWLWPVLKD